LRFVIDKPPATSAHRPLVRAGVARCFNGYVIPGVAVVEAWPHRSLTHARRSPAGSSQIPRHTCWAVRAFNVPGVILKAAA
jgi:hypothetical protein